MPHVRSAVAAAFSVLSALICLASPIAGQIVKGQVVRAGTDEPLADVLVRLVSPPDGRTVAAATTDTAGAFRLHAPRLGVFILSGERIGMTPVRTGELRVNLSEAVEVTLRMAELAVPLEPLTVTARSAVQIGALAGYFERIERQERLGAGHIFTRDRIEERQALDVADLLRDVPSISVVESGNRIPTVYFRSNRGQCIPKVYINGVHQNRGGAAGIAAVVDETVRPYDLEGLEVYRGISEMPGEFYDENHCGVILLWTRRDAEGGRPFSMKRLLVTAAGIGTLMLLLMK